MPTYSLSDLIFRVPLDREMTDAEHDKNLAVLAYMISIMAGGEGAVQSVNGKVGSIELSADDVGALAASALTAINAAIAAKADIAALSTKADAAAVAAALAGKVSTGDPALTNARPPAGGDYSAFVVAGAVATLVKEKVRDALHALVEDARVDQSAMKGFTGQNHGWLVMQGIIARLGLTAGQVLGPVAVVGGVPTFTPGSTSVISFATLDDFLTGDNPNLLISAATARYMGKRRTRAYAATLTLRFTGARLVDGGNHDSDSLVTKVADVSGNIVVNFNGIHAGLEGECFRVRLVSNTAGARTIAVSTANGITVDANGITIPNLGANVGDAVEVIGTIVSPTLVRLDRVVVDPA